MPVERSARVVAVEGAGVALELQPGCSGCGGCGGHCDVRRLLRTNSDVLEFPRAAFTGPVGVGDVVVLRWDVAAVSAAARRGYALPVLGLVLGAGFGWQAAALAGWPLNVGTLFGAIVGTFAGSMRSNPRRPLPAGFSIR